MIPWWLNPWGYAKALERRNANQAETILDLAAERDRLSRQVEIFEAACETYLKQFDRQLDEIARLKVELAQLKRGLALQPGDTELVTPGNRLPLDMDLNDPEVIRQADNAQSNRVAFQQARELNRKLRYKLGEVVAAAYDWIETPGIEKDNSKRSAMINLLDLCAKETNLPQRGRAKVNWAVEP